MRAGVPGRVFLIVHLLYDLILTLQYLRGKKSDSENLAAASLSSQINPFF